MELYFSVDIEADGPIPGEYSMLSFGAAAFTKEGKLVDVYYSTLDFLPGAKQDLDTMNWWKTQPEAWKKCRENTKDPNDVMPIFVEWVDNICKTNKAKPVFVGYPAGFDFMFMYWYMIKFAGRSPFSFSSLDIKSFVMPMLGTSFRNTSKRNFPKRWFSKTRHTHVALDDAIEQGEMFCNILKDLND